MQVMFFTSTVLKLWDIIICVICNLCRCRWPHGLRRGSAAARLLGLRVRIPLGAWMCVVSVVCYQVEVAASGWSLVQRSPTECGVSECDRGSAKLMRPWPTGGLSFHEKKCNVFFCCVAYYMWLVSPTEDKCGNTWTFLTIYWGIAGSIKAGCLWEESVKPLDVSTRRLKLMTHFLNTNCAFPTLEWFNWER